MHRAFKLLPTMHFMRNYKSIVKRNPRVSKRIKKTLNQMRINPFYKGLKTHKVDAHQLGIHYSSRVSGDIRIIWNFQEDDNLVIILLLIGGHSGKRKVYC
ncbi:type II toxin-antitoxin system RelE/ParE family toxin [Patescibacteria group bacterium]